jgi:putative transcriptional regulator
MSRRVADDIIAGLEDAISIARGEAAPGTFRVHVPERIDVRAIRAGLGMTQARFAAAFGLSLHTLRKWEQEGREPEGPARAYLKVISRNPDAVREALQAA